MELDPDDIFRDEDDDPENEFYQVRMRLFSQFILFVVRKILVPYMCMFWFIV